MSRYVIEKDKLDENIEIVKDKAKVPVIAVVKGNGYGFGIKELTKILVEHDIKTFAVTEVTDLKELREVIKDEDIIVLRSTCVYEECFEIAKYNATAVIGSIESAEIMNKVAKEQNKIIKCNLKIDTGMGRYGFLPSQIDDAIKCYSFDNLKFVGAYTHFPTAFMNDGSTKAQQKVFEDTMKKIKENVGEVGTLHCANSPALFNFSDISLDSVRVGSAFTGRIISWNKTGLNKVGMLEAEIINTKIIPQGYTIGYGGNYKAKKETKIAIIPFGHYDGFGVGIKRERYNLRAVFSTLKSYIKNERIYVSINGKNYPIIGDIGLDHCTVDITGTDIKVGDVAKADISPLFVNPRIPRIYK